MALFIRQDENRTELQKRLATELQGRAKERAKELTSDLPDGVDDSQYIKGTKKTTSLAWVWALILIATVAIIIRFVMLGMATN